MKSILAKISSVAAGAVALVVGGAVAGLGLTMLAFLAIIGLASFGVAVLMLPFAKPVDWQSRFDEMNEFRKQAPAS